MQPIWINFRRWPLFVLCCVLCTSQALLVLMITRDLAGSAMFLICAPFGALFFPPIFGLVFRMRITEEGIVTQPALCPPIVLPWEDVSLLRIMSSRTFLPYVLGVPLPKYGFNMILFPGYHFLANRDEVLAVIERYTEAANAAEREAGAVTD